MKRVLSFEDYIQKNNESDLFGVTTGGMGNYPAGYEGQKAKRMLRTTEELILLSTI